MLLSLPSLSLSKPSSLFSTMWGKKPKKEINTTKNNATLEDNKKAEPLVKTEDIEDTIPSFSIIQTRKLRASLLDWYDHNRRDLPWRTTLNHNAEEEEVEKRAYGVWVSEIMLQQTRVQTVIDYYNRWMEKWPTVHHLAEATLEEVNEMWAGLGYYTRARNLLKGAQRIVEKEGGRIPKTASMLQKVPGIGEYTAGAIASIAFQEAVPAVDGNVLRVIGRLRAVSENPKESIIAKRIREIAAELVDPLRPGDFNQALMELGATVCTLSNPSCSSCPASEFCSARSIDIKDSTAAVTDYPVKGVKVKQRCDFSAVCVVELLDENKSSSKFIIVKRPDEGLLAGLWEFPSVLVDGGTVSSARRTAINRFLKKQLKINIKKNCDIVSREDVGEFVHIFTHIRLKLHVELLQLKGTNEDFFKGQCNKTTTWKCVTGDALSSMGLTTSVRKVYNMVQEFKQKKLPSVDVPTKKRRRTTEEN